MEVLTVELTIGDLSLLQEALDSHEYWQLSEPRDRSDGYSTVADGADEEIDAVRALAVKLSAAARPTAQAFENLRNDQ